jgi:hypothetical protein
MIRCLIDSDSFEPYDHPHKDLHELSILIETACEVIRDEMILDLPDTFNVLITCNPNLVRWDSPGMHCAATQTVYLSGVYQLEDLIKFLCHELVHVEQVNHHILTYDPQVHALAWFGIPTQFGEDISDEEYRNYPWEQDAYSRDHKVYRALVKVLTGEDVGCQNDLAVTRSVAIESRLLN